MSEVGELDTLTVTVSGTVRDWFESHLRPLDKASEPVKDLSRKVTYLHSGSSE